MLVSSNHVDSAFAAATIRVFRDAPTWAINNLYLKGRRYYYDGLEPWIPFLREDHPNKLCYKARGVTFSYQEQITMFCNLSAEPLANGLFMFPTQDLAAKYVMEQMNPFIDGCPGIRLHLKGDNVETKIFTRRIQSEDGFPIDHDQSLYLVGAHVSTRAGSEGDRARSLRFDFINYDERQKMGYDIESVIGQTAALSYFKDKKNHRLTGGTPTIAGAILDILWDKSDQKIFHVKCPRCSTWQPLNENNLIILKAPRENMYIGCVRCAMSLEEFRGRMIPGRTEWVKTRTNGPCHYSGWKFNKFILNPIAPEDKLTHLYSAKAIHSEIQDSKTERYLQNEIFGNSYSGGSVPFPKDLLYACLDPDIDLSEARMRTYAYLTLAVDWGVPTWYLVEGTDYAGHRTLLDFGHTTEPDERYHSKDVHEKTCRYMPGVVFADKGYSKNMTMDFVELFKKAAVFAVEYGYEAKTEKPSEKVHVVRDEHYIWVDRNYIIEATQDILIGDPETGEKWYHIPGKRIDEVQEFLSHFLSIVTLDDLLDEEKTGIAEEIKHGQCKYGRIGPDHLAHCCFYNTLPQITRRIPVPGMKKFEVFP